MLNLKILKNEEISDELLNKIELFDRKIFPEDNAYSFPDGYLRNLYYDSKEAMFVLLNNNYVVGYLNAVFLSDEDYENYIKNPDYKKLKNIGLHDGDNNMYFYTVALMPELRHTVCIKFLMYEFVHWLTAERLNGRKVTRTITEIITDDGLRFSKYMGFQPLNGGERDFGLYYSPDNLLNYMKSTLEENTNLKDFNKLVVTLRKSSEILDKFSDKKDAVNYLMTKSGKTKSECNFAYDIIKDLKLSEFEDKLDREIQEEFTKSVVELAKFYKLPVFLVTKNLTSYYNEDNNRAVKEARDNYLDYYEEELMKDMID